MMDNLLQLKDKNIVVMGVANDRSIAWGIAKRLFDVGANVIFTYRQERSLKNYKTIRKYRTIRFSCCSM